jgi:hypothetical protein
MRIQPNPTSSFPTTGSNTGVKPKPKATPVTGWVTFENPPGTPAAKPGTPAAKPVNPITMEWKPTPEQFGTDKLHLQRFDLKDTLLTAQHNYNVVTANRKSTKTDLRNATNDLRKAKSNLEEFEKKNPNLKRATIDLASLLIQYEEAKKAVLEQGFKVPTELMNAARDLIGGYWDGVYPSTISAAAVRGPLLVEFCKNYE